MQDVSKRVAQILIEKLGIAESSPILRQVLFMGSKMNDGKVDSSGPSYANIATADDSYVVTQSSLPIDVSQAFWVYQFTVVHLSIPVSVIY